jgi:hypothetical protein
METSRKYCDYFDVDEKYFPQINEASIKEYPDCWLNTYPHRTFVDMLRNMERLLSENGHSLWIQGSYGVGKSQCAYTLKRILDAPEEELRSYWEKYSKEALANENDLLEKFIGHRNRDNGIITAYRYSTTDVTTPRHFYDAIQQTIKAQLHEKGLYEGDETFRESVIAWMEEHDGIKKDYLNRLLKLPQYDKLFAEPDADAILEKLRKGGTVAQLMRNLFVLAEKENLPVLEIDVDKLIIWLEDVIEKNNIKIVFIWDQFNDFFDASGGKVDAFQKVCELVNYKSFFFIPVTHNSGNEYIKDRDAWRSISDRFIETKIALPDSIAFNLIGHALKVKDSRLYNWNILVNGDLGSRTTASRDKVMQVAKINDSQIMRNIMPLHPMAALVLENIASVFKSNQRSMFDFIKSTDTYNVEAFQWFIENFGPFDDHPLLTVDMLWSFFYESGRDNLPYDVQRILDTFSQHQNLRDDEKTVLKAILIMQAIDEHRHGEIEIFKATSQNLSYVFEGISDLEGARSDNIAKRLKEEGVLMYRPTHDGQNSYVAAKLIGDQRKIDATKEEIRHNATTLNLVNDGGLSSIVSLSTALKLRFECKPGTGEIKPVTVSNFAKEISLLQNASVTWKFPAVIAFAKNNEEAFSLRKKLREAASDERNKNIVFIDALSTPLGDEMFEQYVDFAANKVFYESNNSIQSSNYKDKAQRILSQDWKNQIQNGKFIVYTYANQEGETLGNARDVGHALRRIVLTKFPNAFDFTDGVKDTQLKIGHAMQQAAKYGISQSGKSAVNGAENLVLKDVWNADRYWENTLTSSLPISQVKIAVNALIEEAFADDGRVSIGDIYDFLETKYGFSPCNLSSFITGFLLKEYAGAPYRYSDSIGSYGEMTNEKLAEMIGNYIWKSPKPTYIVKMTPEEKAFCSLTRKAWHMSADSCSSAGSAIISLRGKMRELRLPIWTLERINTVDVHVAIKKYTELLQQQESADAHKIALEIGKIAASKSSLAEDLSGVLTVEKCQSAMREYLKIFENGKVWKLAGEIGATDNVLYDLINAFNVEYSCLWNKQMGDDEIGKLLTEYSVIKATNSILSLSNSRLTDSYEAWRNNLKFIGISCDALQAEYPELRQVLNLLLTIYQQEELTHEQLKTFSRELARHDDEIRRLLNRDSQVFGEVYEQYLDELNLDEIIGVKNKLQKESLFTLSKNESNIKVRDAKKEFLKDQSKSKLFRFWKDKTGTKDPREWSNLYKVPVLCCVSEAEYESAKKTFEIMNRNWGQDSEIEKALSFLKSSTIFEILSDGEKRNGVFKNNVVGEYSVLFQDLSEIKDVLENLPVDIYDWYDSPIVKARIKKSAEAEYNAGVSDKVLQKLDKMSDPELRQYLEQLVKDSALVGAEILAKEGKDATN